MNRSHGPCDCRQAVRQLYDYVDNALTSDQLEAMRRHLTHCTGCHEHVELARKFLHQLGSCPVPAHEVAAVAARIRDALRKEAARE
jgi:anti-sigma factor RsiW